MANVALISVSEELCFGLRYVAANLRKHGHRATFIAFNVTYEFLRPVEHEIVHPELGIGLRANEKGISLLVELLRSLKTDVVGMTVYSTCYDTAALLAGRLREAGGYPIVWGGVDVLFNPEDALQHADIICMADGEQAMVEIAEVLTGGGNLGDIKGIWFRGENGTIKRTGARPRIEDLDSLPVPEWDLSDTYYVSENRVWHREYHPYGILQPHVRFIITGRGCPFRCTYCCNNATGRRIYYGGPLTRRSVGNVVQEARGIRDRIRSVGHIFFMDEIFTIGKEWLGEFCERWPKEVGLPFMVLTHPTTTRMDVIRMLRGAGLCGVTMGIQTGSERINREVFGRPTSREQIVAAGGVMAENGVGYVVELIHENPYETEEDYRETAQTLRELPRPYTLGSVNPLQLWSNYDITKQALADGADIVQANSHTYLSRKKPEYDFWRAIYHLVALCPMDSEALDFVMQARGLPGGGGFVRRLSDHLQSATYRSRHPLERSDKDELIERLEGRLARLEGSRMVRYWFGLKERIGQMGPRRGGRRPGDA